MLPVMKIALLLTSCAIAPGCALRSARAPQEPAKPPTISTNRPSFSDSASLVPAGHFQIENGYTFTKRRDDGVATTRQAVPDVLARVRVLDRLEAQVLWGGYLWQGTREAGSTTRTDGASDLGFGLRVPIAEQDGWLPMLSLGGILTVGSGDDTFSTGGHAVPTGKVLWAYSLPGGCGLGGNLIAACPYDGTDRFEQLAASVWGTVPLAENTTLYGEYFVVGGNGVGPANSIGSGLLHLLSRTVQVDVRVGCGLDSNADDFFTGLGVSFLF